MKILQYIYTILWGFLLLNASSCSTKNTPIVPQQNTDVQLRSTENNPCFDYLYYACEAVVDEVDKIIDLPGYCEIKATYKIRRCPTSGIIIYNLELISWDYTGDCFNYWISVFNSCSFECANQSYICLVRCYSEAKKQLELDLKRFIIDDFITNNPLSNGDAGLCGQPPYLLEGIFQEQLCYQICYNPNAEKWNQIKKYVCGDGCCSHTRYYCKESPNDPPTFSFEAFSQSGLNCGIYIVNCDEGYHKEGGCDPENCGL